MKALLPFAALLLASTGIALAQQAEPSVAAPVQSEDQRLLQFLDDAFDVQTRLNPQLLTTLGSREQYDR